MNGKNAKKVKNEKKLKTMNYGDMNEEIIMKIEWQWMNTWKKEKWKKWMNQTMKNANKKKVPKMYGITDDEMPKLYETKTIKKKSEMKNPNEGRNKKNGDGRWKREMRQNKENRNKHKWTKIKLQYINLKKSEYIVDI